MNTPNFDPLIGAKNFEPLLVGGKLYVTPKQYQALLEVSRRFEDPGVKPLSSLLGGIPVLVVPPGEPMDVGGGQMAACMPDGSNVVFYPKDIAIAPGPLKLDDTPSLADPPITFGGAGPSRGVFRNEQPEQPEGES